jgi:hypothetical protein
MWPYKIYCLQNQENVMRSFMKNLYSAVKTKISNIILKIVCWHIFKAFLAKSHYENPFYELNFIIIKTDFF